MRLSPRLQIRCTDRRARRLTSSTRLILAHRSTRRTIRQARETITMTEIAPWQHGLIKPRIRPILLPLRPWITPLRDRHRLHRTTHRVASRLKSLVEIHRNHVVAPEVPPHRLARKLRTSESGISMCHIFKKRTSSNFFPSSKSDPTCFSI